MLPIQYLPIVYVLITLDISINCTSEVFTARVIPALIMAFIFFVNIMLLNGGGGDMLVVPIVALEHGLIPSIYIVLGSCIITTLVVLLKQKIKQESLNLHQEFPFVPGFTITYLLYLVLTNFLV
jgi:hypothetical protein